MMCLGKVTPEIRGIYNFGSLLGRGSTSIVREVAPENAQLNSKGRCVVS